jgi:hypothetical protein
MQTAAKTEWPSTQRPQETQGRKLGYYNPQEQVRQDPFSDRRARAEATQER